MTATTKIICPCCGKEVDYLVEHHWFGEDGSTLEKEVCYNCNSLLQSSNFGIEGNHFLPSWKVQVEVVRLYNGYESHRHDGKCLCLKCGYEWYPARPLLHPEACPQCKNPKYEKPTLAVFYAALCKSPAWNKPRKKR